MNMNVFEVLDDALSAAGESHGNNKGRNGADGQFVTRDEQVVQFLAAHEGYAWQGDIGDELEWTKSKTSRTLSEMESDGRITRYQIGRRKVVCLPHREPEYLGDRSAGSVRS